MLFVRSTCSPSTSSPQDGSIPRTAQLAACGSACCHLRLHGQGTSEIAECAFPAAPLQTLDSPGSGAFESSVQSGARLFQITPRLSNPVRTCPLSLGGIWVILGDSTFLKAGLRLPPNSTYRTQPVRFSEFLHILHASVRMASHGFSRVLMNYAATSTGCHGECGTRQAYWAANDRKAPGRQRGVLDW